MDIDTLLAYMTPNTLVHMYDDITDEKPTGETINLAEAIEDMLAATIGEAEAAELLHGRS